MGAESAVGETVGQLADLRIIDELVHLSDLKADLAALQKGCFESTRVAGAEYGSECENQAEPADID